MEITLEICKVGLKLQVARSQSYELIRVEEWQECQPPYTFAFGVSWHCHVRRLDERRRESNQGNRRTIFYVL